MTVNPAELTRAQRIRIWVGTFLVDYVETFLGLLPVSVIAVIASPALQSVTSIEQAKAMALAVVAQLIGPALAALVSAGRRALANAWPPLRKFFASGFGAIKSG
jgi:alpha-D-ribose 1-methylphosphonate 5-triphosphate synthase subunit PhnL